MNRPAWVLTESLTRTASEDQPYLGSATGRLGGHEIALTFAPEGAGGNEVRVFLDGAVIFEPGQAGPGAPWFRACRALGFDAERHWDLDEALILFEQVLPALAAEWEEVSLPEGLPEGLVSLRTVQGAWERGVRSLQERARGEAAEQAAACFARLPLRTLTFHDDPRQREDFVGNNLDEPFLGIFARLGPDPTRRITLSRATLHATGGMKWSPWRLGGDWKEGDRDFLATRDPGELLRAAGLEGPVPEGFRSAVGEAVASLGKALDPAVASYQATHPVGIPWHRDPRTRYLHHTIVDVRLGSPTVLVLDDGTEVKVAE